MSITTLNEGNYPSDWLKGESHAGEFYSRDTGIALANNGKMNSGQVFGQITLGAASVAVKASGANTGNGTLILDPTTPILAGAMAGLFQVRCIAASANAATFRVTDPKGLVLGDFNYSGSGASATFADRIKITATDGATDYVVGDGYDVTIAAGSMKYVPVNPAALDGSAVACAILFNKYADTTQGDANVVLITRAATVCHAGLTWGPNITTSTQRAVAATQLAGFGIIDRQAA